jgi:hypothetical protein
MSVWLSLLASKACQLPPNTHAYRLLIFKEHLADLSSAQKRDYHPLLLVLSSSCAFFVCKSLTGEASCLRALVRPSGHMPAAACLTPRNQSPCTAGAFDLWAIGSLTMSYFHTGIRTIIGAESFHCSVRDGKEWDQLAMVIRLKTVLACKADVLIHRPCNPVNSKSRFNQCSGLERYLDCASQRIPARQFARRYPSI